MANRLNVDRLARELSSILSEKYGANVKITYTLKPEYAKEVEKVEADGVTKQD